MKNPVKEEIRKRIKEMRGGPMIPGLERPRDAAWLRMNTREWESIIKWMTQTHNRTFAWLTEPELKKSTLYPQILAMRKNKEEDREETAKLIKQALKEIGRSYEEMNEMASMLLKSESFTFNCLELARTDIAREVGKALKPIPIWSEWLAHIRGIGPRIAGTLIGELKDIQRFANPSALWHYCGQHVVDGAAPKRKRGVEADWSPRMKTLCFYIGEQFERQSNDHPYKQLYNKRKAYIKAKNPDISGMHARMRARRYATKRFLCDFFVAWYRSIGVEPPSKPWILEQPNHHDDGMAVEYPFEPALQ